MNLCKCGHIETGHVVHRVHSDPPTSYRGFCVIDPKCDCNLFVPSGEEAVLAPRAAGFTQVKAADKRESIAEMLAAAASAVAPREKTAREILKEAAPDVD